MNIIIAGAGAVGTHLAKLFSREHHDITLIDADGDRLQDVGMNFDLLTIEKDPLSIETLREAEVRKSDLFIAVTPDVAHNLTVCMLASKLGAKQTIARVNSYEYVSQKNENLFKEAGIDMLIYPEEMAGKEIAGSISRSWTRQWIPLQGGSLILIGVKLRKGARLLNTPLKEISQTNTPYHIVAVKRKEEMMIPHGNDCLLEQDFVYFMTTEREVNKLKELCGKEDYPDVQNVFFLGGGTITERALAHLPDYMHAKVFESDKQVIRHLQTVIDNHKVMYINDDGRNIEVLLDEGITHVQGFIAATESSATNVLACLNAKKLGVRKTVAMIDNPNYVTMAQSLDIGSIIDKKVLAADRIYQRILHADVTNVKSLVVANADICELMVNEGSQVTKHIVKDLKLPSNVTLGGMVRDGKSYLINGDTQLIPGDLVVAICVDNSLKKMEKFFY